MWLYTRLRKLAAAVRDGVDGRLHARRRAEARRRLRELAPGTVLFVCLGNICRSPFGERLVAARSPAGPAVGSVGFIGPGRPPPHEAVAAAAERGIDHSDHRSTTLTAERLAEADAVLAFDRENLKMLRSVPGARAERAFWLGDFDPLWSGRRAIIDPWGRGDEAFRDCFARIERCVDALLADLTPVRTGSAAETPEPLDGLPRER
jgi:protein-tyrosine phosphatase